MKREDHDQLKNLMRGKLVIVGVGNSLRGDDGLGPLLVERLKKKVKVPCINAGSSLENYLGKILEENPETVLVIDAVHLGLAPGAYEVIDPSDAAQSGFSTHDSSKLCFDLLSSSIKGKVLLLGVQPKRLELGSEMSEEISRALQMLEERISGAVRLYALQSCK